MKTRYSNPIDHSDVNSIDGLFNLYNKAYFFDFTSLGTGIARNVRISLSFIFKINTIP